MRFVPVPPPHRYAFQVHRVKIGHLTLLQGQLPSPCRPLAYCCSQNKPSTLYKNVSSRDMFETKSSNQSSEKGESLWFETTPIIFLRTTDIDIRDLGH